MAASGVYAGALAIQPRSSLDWPLYKWTKEDNLVSFRNRLEVLTELPRPTFMFCVCSTAKIVLPTIHVDAPSALMAPDMYSGYDFEGIIAWSCFLSNSLSFGQPSQLQG